MDTMTQSPQTTQKHILDLLADLPPESLRFIEQFVLFLREQTQMSKPLTAQEKRAPYLYPTVAAPASTIDAWMNLLPEGYEGDALADTEALYDDV